MASLAMVTIANADSGQGKWVKTDFGTVWLDNSYKTLGKGAQESALIVGYGNPNQYFNGKNLDTCHWLAYDGQVTSYSNWFTYRATETYGNQKTDVPIILKNDTWYDIPVGK
jgi:hypothetical protein